MTILVSACLLGENCKYNGGNNRNERVLRYVDGHEVIPVCPEMLGGLPSPHSSTEGAPFIFASWNFRIMAGST